VSNPIARPNPNGRDSWVDAWRTIVYLHGDLKNSPSTTSLSRADFDVRAADYTHSLRNRAFYQYWVNQALPLVNLPDQPPQILEMGCGSGFSTECFLSQFQFDDYLGTDISEAMLNEARARLRDANPRLRFVKAPAEATPLPDNSVNLIVSSFAFHWFDLEKAFQEIFRLLTDDGFAFLIVPSFSGSLAAESGNHLLKRSYLRHWRRFRHERTPTIGMSIERLQPPATAAQLELTQSGHVDLVEDFKSSEDLFRVLDSRGSLRAIFGAQTDEVEFDALEEPLPFRWRTAYLLFQRQR